MALTDTQKAQVRMYLGYPDILRDRNTRLESVLSNLSADAETLVVAMLTRIAAVDNKVFGTVLTSAGVQQVDEIRFFEGKTVQESIQLGRVAIGRLSTIFGVPRFADYFSGAGYPGDNYAEGIGNDQLPGGGGGGNTFGLG